MLSMLLLFTSSSVSAVTPATPEEVVVGAAKATIEKARAEGGVIDISSKHKITLISERNASYATKDLDRIAKLSAMRPQAELYYSYNNNSYGPTTSSCSGGLFGASGSMGGMKEQVNGLKKDGYSLSCAATKGTSYVVTVKLSDKGYWCVDSTGASVRVLNPAKSGATTCGKSAPEVRRSVTTDIISASNNIQIYPLINSRYNAIVQSKVVGIKTDEDGSPQQSLVVLKDGVSYRSLDKVLLLLLSYAPSDITKPFKDLKGYVSFDEPMSLLNNLVALSEKDIDLILNNVLGDNWFTAKFLKSSANGETYQVTVPIKELFKKTSTGDDDKMVAVGTYIVNSVFSKYSVTNTSIVFTVVVKDGLITSIKTKENQKLLAGKNKTDLINISIGISKKPFPNLINPSDVIKCTDLFKSSSAEEYCGKFDMEKAMKEARAKASAAAVQAWLSNMRPQAELYYSNTSHYGPATQSCDAGMFADNGVGGLKTMISGVRTTTNDIVCTTSNVNTAGAQSWMVSAKVNDQYYCSDSTGYVGNSSQKSTTDTKCQ